MPELTSARPQAVSRSVKRRRISRLIKNRWLYIMAIPGMIYFLIFKYIPMWGLLIAFQDYQPTLGLLQSKWVGLRHFERFFFDSSFLLLFKNTFLLAVYHLLFFFPLPIVLALLLNEVRKELFKRTIQTIVYIPHFVSWVVVAGITYIFFTTEGGIVNEALAALGFEKVNFLISNEWFRTIIVSQAIWKDTGWGTIIFLAALAGVDRQLYEAATIDGAGRFRQVWHITLPAMRSVIVVLLILRLGDFLDTGFEQIFLMLNAMNSEVGEVFDTYVYKTGILRGQFSYSTAVGLFKSIVGFVLVVGANRLAKNFGESGLY
ncbi:ABC transporter permease [Paenibacillus tyrfis]|uniref:ABC transporter permease n=1 Tax=Paenibacillus tyrfis TaxID=1501230 RepID=UPI000B592708|nr:sugar ABC transporter permease [Paenibacillus tyrfis]